MNIGDYVNGDKVGYIDDLKGCMRQFNYDYENPNDDVGHWEEEIKSIVTKEQVKQAVLDMYKLAGDNNLYYYEQIQEIIDYIAELEMKIDKAVEYVKNTTLFTEEYDYDYEENLVWKGATDDEEREELLNILNGEDNE